MFVKYICDFTVFVCVCSSEVSCGQAVQTQGSCVSGTLTTTDSHPKESPCQAAQEWPVWFVSRTRWAMITCHVTNTLITLSVFCYHNRHLPTPTFSQCPQIWVGCCSQGSVGGQLRGQVMVVDPESHTVAKELQAHSDSIQTLCSAEDRYVLSGSACRDGKIAIWKVE